MSPGLHALKAKRFVLNELTLPYLDLRFSAVPATGDTCLLSPKCLGLEVVHEARVF